MKWIFQIFLAIHKGLYRISGGRIGGKMQGAEVLLLSTVGRKSSKKRVTPLMFIRRDKSFVVVASNGGQPSHPGWYYNIQDQSPIEVQIMKKTYIVSATEAQGDQRATLYEQFINVSEQYARYAQNTDRDIPVIIFTPIK
jgi:deazaflavin-dependent oxidoreductase (nitroreductase family)